MTFIDFLNSTAVYGWYVVALSSIVGLAYSIKFIRRYIESRKLGTQAPAYPLLTEKELTIMLKKVQGKKVASISLRSDKKVKKTKVKEVLEDTESIKPWNIIKSKKIFSYARWKEWYLDKYHTGKIVLIHMELKNGFFSLFTVKEKDDGFVFRGSKYVFSEQNKVYNIDAKLYEFFYHEEICLPISLKIPVTEIKKNIESTEGIDVEYAINPATLQRFMTAKIAEGVMRGTQLDEFMRRLQMFLIVTMITVLAHLALFLYASGILQNIKVAGIIG